MSQLDLFAEPEKRMPHDVNRPSSAPAPLGSAIRKTQEYQEYIDSAQWRRIRAQKFKMVGKKCERCEATHTFEVHHKTYERFKKELPSDLEVLCKPHHNIADHERVQALQRNFEEICEAKRYVSARETYIEKVYGGYATSAAQQEFDEWLERKKENQFWNGSD